MKINPKRVLLIAPRIVGIKGGINRIQPSLGLGYLAAILEQRGHEPIYYDAALGEGQRTEMPIDGNAIVIGEPDSVIANKIAAVNPDFIGISILFSGTASQGLRIAELAKQVLPNVPVIIGGNHVSGVISDYEYAKSLPVQHEGLKRGLHDLLKTKIDYAMIGECDFAFSDMIDALSRGEDPYGLPGVVAFKDGEVRFPKERPAIDIRQLPLPARHLMDMDGYFNWGRFHSSKSTSNRVLSIMASRGCPEKCAFCSTPRLWGAKVRWRDHADIMNEIKTSIDRYGIQEVQFEDDTLTANINHLKTLCDLMHPLGIPWCTPNGIKANYHAHQQSEIFKRMKDSGCYQVTLACESGVQRVLDEIVGKKLKVDEVAPAIARAIGAGLFVHTFWIAGFPGETRDEMEKSIEVASQCGADSVSFSILNPLPGTPIFRQVVEKNLWWPEIVQGRETNYRRSSIKVDGFNSADEFEKWVAGVNDKLNKQLAAQDPLRAERRANLVHDKAIAKSGMKQT